MKKYKKKLIHLRWSDFPRESWISITLTNPSEYSEMNIKRSGKYVMYEAFFPFMKEKRLFRLVLPYGKFMEALKAIPQELRNDIHNPITFEIFKGRNGVVRFKNWKKIKEAE